MSSISKIVILAWFLFSCTFTNAQSTEKMWESILDHIEFSQDTVHSVFKWVAQFISYDQNMVPADGIYHSKTKLIQDALRTRKGVCEHYAELFHGLMVHLGYQAQVVGGYVRQNGTINSDYGHVWNAVKVDGQWYLFDPTWASGYTENGRFIPDYTEEWYKSLPQDFIQTHMPFDPLWQLLEKPLLHSEFYASKFSFQSNQRFNPEVDIPHELKKSETEKLASHIERIEAAGIPNNLTRKRLSRLKVELENRTYNEQLDALNFQIDAMNEVVVMFNNYVEARNQGFKRGNWTKEKISDTVVLLNQKMSDLVTYSENLPAYSGSKSQPFSSFKTNVQRMSREVNKVYLEATNK